MRSLQLQAALAEFLAQAAESLQADLLAGQEIPFELASHSARGRSASPLYCYRPLTGAFVAERFPKLRDLDGYARAAGLLECFDGLERYLISTGSDRARRGMRGRGDAALLALLQEVFGEQTDFELRPECLDRVLERLDGSALAAAGGEVTLVATLHGLTISSPELALTRGLLIAQPDALQGAPEPALHPSVHAEQDHLLVVLTAESHDPPAAIAQGTEVVRELLRALRLFGDGRITLGALAWTRIGSAPWETLALGSGGRPHGMLLVSVEQEDELRAFCNLISRRAPHASALAWAMRRFELGCERTSEYDGISDHLMALRVLLGAPSELEPEGSPDGLLAGRLAALCATPDQRSALAERTLRAIALERHAIAGTAAVRASGLAVARDLSNHLRALLRDVICGHLPSDLASLADELLLSGEDLSEEASGDSGEAAEVLHVAV
ncbi:MAG TPA: hypothetical protein VK781_10310 [Solirubrobacteraceae bacterium]|nr:hypothetical protein [Solirubrobacteraceae bacterium]